MLRQTTLLLVAGIALTATAQAQSTPPDPPDLKRRLDALPPDGRVKPQRMKKRQPIPEKMRKAAVPADKTLK